MLVVAASFIVQHMLATILSIGIAADKWLAAVFSLAIATYMILLACRNGHSGAQRTTGDAKQRRSSQLASIISGVTGLKLEIPEGLVSHNRKDTETELPTNLPIMRLEEDGDITPKAHEIIPEAVYRLQPENDRGFCSHSHAQNMRATNVSLLPPLAMYAMGDLEGMSELLFKKARFGRWKTRRLKLTSGPGGFILVRSVCSGGFSFGLGPCTSGDTPGAREKKSEKCIAVLSIRPGSIYAYTRLKTASKPTITKQQSDRNSRSNMVADADVGGKTGGSSSVWKAPSIRSETLVAVHQLWHFETKCGRKHTFRSSSQRQAMSWYACMMGMLSVV